MNLNCEKCGNHRFIELDRNTGDPIIDMERRFVCSRCQAVWIWDMILKQFYYGGKSERRREIKFLLVAVVCFIIYIVSLGH